MLSHGKGAKDILLAILDCSFLDVLSHGKGAKGIWLAVLDCSFFRLFFLFLTKRFNWKREPLAFNNSPKIFTSRVVTVKKNI